MDITVEFDADLKPVYAGPITAPFTASIDLNKAGQERLDDGDGQFYSDKGLVYRTSKKKAEIIFWGDIVLAAIVAAKTCPEVRADLLSALAGDGGAE
jgi:hypothetical protein